MQVTASPHPSSRMRFRLGLSLVVAAASIASAQAQTGLTFKVRTQLRNNPVPEKARPDSVRIKRQIAEQMARNADIDTNADTPPTGGRGAGGNTGTNRVLMMNGSA